MTWISESGVRIARAESASRDWIADVQTIVIVVALVAVAACRGAGCAGTTDAVALPVDPAESAGEMVLIPAGTFTMGDGAGRPDETPHTVSVSSFYLDKYPVTQELYEKVMGVNPSKQKGKKNPVERTQWTDAVRFCNKCSELEGLTPCYDLDTWECNFDADGYRLPTEAEWEYACRAGSTGKYCFGDDETELPQIRLVQAAFARQAAAGRPEAAQPLGPLRHARQRLAMVQRLVRRDLLRGKSGGEPARPGHGQDARAARRRLGLHRREAAGRPTVTRSFPFTPTPASAPTATASGGRGRPMAATSPRRSPPARRPLPCRRTTRASRPMKCPLPRVSPAPGSGKIDLASLKGTIVFVSDRSGTMKIWSMHASGKDAKQLTKGTDPDADPRFSPDGKRILYTTLRGGFPEVWLMNRDGSEPKFVTKGSQGELGAGRQVDRLHPGQPDLRPRPRLRPGTTRHARRNGSAAAYRRSAPDGKHFAVASRHLGNIGIFILSLDGKENDQLKAERGLLYAAMVEGRQEDPLPDGPGPHPPGRSWTARTGTS